MSSCQASSINRNSCTAHSRCWTSRSTRRMGFNTRCAWRGQCVASCVALSALVLLMSHFYSCDMLWLPISMCSAIPDFDCSFSILSWISYHVLIDLIWSCWLRSAPPKHSPTSHSSFLARSPAFRGAESEPPPAPEEEALDKDQVKPVSAAYGRSL